MKRIINKFVSVLLIISTLLLSVNITAANENKLVAFPGAEGGGMYSKGARAASSYSIYHVTNLNDSGTGSFRDAVSRGNRIIVFDVAGNIMLNNDMYITSSNLTILGQTAPGEGICVGGESVRFGRCNNVILRYMKFRMGDNSESEEDCLGVRKSTDFIIDHCSVEWSVDECLSAYENKNFTAQYCIISESLNNSVHSKGAHGYGGIWGGTNASFHHNLLSSHKARMPRIGSSATVTTYEGALDTDSLIDVRNNVVYNYRSTIGYGGENATRVNFVNNYYKPSDYSSKKVRFYTAYGTRGTTLYVDGNYMEGNDTFNNDNWTLTSTDEDLKLKNISDGIVVDGVLKSNDEYIYDYPVNTVSAQEAYTDVIANAGACTVRDYTDTRIINDVINGTYPMGSKGSAGLIDSQEDVGGWNGLYGNKAPDSDNDGIPDEWEIANGLNPKVNDSILISENGYTNIENYANSIVTNNYNSTDKSTLWELMNTVEKLNSSDYFAELWVDVETAFEKGKAVRADINSTQESIDTVAEELKYALDNLKEDKRNELTSIISKSETADKQLYTAESWADLMAEVEKGKVILEEEYNEENVLNAVENINNAFNSLEKSNRTELIAVIEKYLAYDNDGWTEESYNNLRNVLTEAQGIYNDFNYNEEGYLSEIEIINNAVASLKTEYEAESEILDFEDIALGEYSDSYTYNNFKYTTNPQGNKFSVVNYNGNKVYMTNSENVQISRQYDNSLQGVYSVEGDFLMTEVEASMHEFISIFNTNTNIDLNSIGEMTLEAGGESYYLMTPEADTWYNIKAVVNIDNETISVYVDGKLIKKDIPFNTNNITGFLIGNNSNRMGSLYCDNIKITRRIYPELLYGDVDCDGTLTSEDVALILSKTLNDDITLDIENKTKKYLKYVDVDNSGDIDSADVAIVLQKVFDNGYKMPVERENEDVTDITTTEATTETTSDAVTETQTIEDKELNMDMLSPGQLASPYIVNGFTLTSKTGNTIDVVENPVGIYGEIYNNAVYGYDTEISFTVEAPCRIEIVGTSPLMSVPISITGKLENGDNYSVNRYAETSMSQNGYGICAARIPVEAGTYTLNCGNMMINAVRLYN